MVGIVTSVKPRPSGRSDGPGTYHQPPCTVWYATWATSLCSQLKKNRGKKLKMETGGCINSKGKACESYGNDRFV